MASLEERRVRIRPGDRVKDSRRLDGAVVRIREGEGGSYRTMELPTLILEELIDLRVEGDKVYIRPR